MKPFHGVMLLSGLLTVTAGTARAQTAPKEPITQVPVVFSGGHETDPRDRGRPVALIAGALGVPPDVFREAFTHVRPAPAGTEPDPRQVRENKRALLGALGRYGVTNERLDAVSNYYRYVRSRNEMWPTKPATAYAVVKDGAILRYVITSGGSGYSSPPMVSVPSVPGAAALAQIAFNSASDKNGALSAITPAPAKKDARTTKTP